MPEKAARDELREAEEKYYFMPKGYGSISLAGGKILIYPIQLSAGFLHLYIG